VGVEIEGDGNCAVAQRLGNTFAWIPAPRRRGGRRVAEIVEAKPERRAGGVLD